ncbi:MAG: hypothetical protein JXL80_17670 [Planctomycetes bacterium]|nr:hypothetical protein [Planctomycetota bacterium]
MGTGRSVGRGLVSFGPVLIGLLLVASLAALHRYVYDSLCPGVPDVGQCRIATVPWIFWHYESGSVSLARDWHVLVVWLSACAFLAVPPLIALTLSRTGRQTLPALLMCVVLWVSGVWSVLDSQKAYADIFNPPVTPGKLMAAWPGAAWVTLLVLGGAVVGLVYRRLLWPPQSRPDGEP